LSLETCVVSGLLAGIDPDRPDMWIGDLQRFGGTTASLDEWLIIHESLVKLLRKYQGNIGVLQRFAADIVRPFSEKPGFEVFAQRLRGARQCVPSLRLVFSDAASTRAALTRLKLENLDSGILEGEFREAEIAVSPRTDQFRLMATEQVLRQVDELVADTRQHRNLSGESR